MFRVKTFAAVALLVPALALGGCSYEKPAEPVEQPVGLTLDAPRVTLEDAGSGELRVLAFKDIDAQQKLDYSVTQGFSQDLLKDSAARDFKASDVDSATTTLPLEASVDKATEDVEGQLPATRNGFVTVGMPSYSGSAQVDSAEGFQFGWRATDSGQLNSLRLAAPQAATDEARGVVEQAIMKLTSVPIVFPKEEVGLGATWTVESRVAGESALLQTTTYTLDKMAGDILTLNVRVAQRPSLGALSFEGQAQGTELENKELEVMDTTTDSTGTLTVDLTQPLPTGGDISFDTKIIYGTEGSDLRVVQSTSTEMSFSPAA